MSKLENNSQMSNASRRYSISKLDSSDDLDLKIHHEKIIKENSFNFTKKNAYCTLDDDMQRQDSEKVGNRQFSVDLRSHEITEDDTTTLPKDDLMKSRTQRRSSNQVQTKFIGAVMKLTQYKNSSLINFYNNIKAMDKRILMLNTEKKQVVFMNKDKETKKIPFSSIIKITIKSRESDYDLTIETKEEYIYMNVTKDDGDQFNIKQAQGWQVGFSSCELGSCIQYDTQKQPDLKMSDITIWNFDKAKVTEQMNMPEMDQLIAIEILSDKIFDYFKVNNCLNANQFKKAIKCISNDTFQEQEIEVLQSNMKSPDSQGIKEKEFLPIGNKIIENIFEKLNEHK